MLIPSILFDSDKPFSKHTNPAIRLMQHQAGRHKTTTAHKLMTNAHGKLRQATKRSMFEPK